jgi:hypothetical protein
MEDLTPQQLSILSWANIIVSGLSLIGEIFMIGTYAYVPTLKTFAMRLIISLIVSDLIYTISTLMSIWNNEYICIAQGFLGQLGVMSGVVWFSCISYISCLQFRRLVRDIDKKFKTMLWLSVGISTVSALV